MFPFYPVITQLQKKILPVYNPQEFFIISVQHLLESTGSLFEAIINIGFNPSNIFLTGKIYSTNEEAQTKLKSLGVNIVDSTIPSQLGHYTESLEKDVDSMWQMLSAKVSLNSKIIILDDGGYALKNIPDNILKNYDVFGIEQTTSGIRMQNAFGKFPVIHLAASAAKIIIEPPIVSESVKIQLGKMIEDAKPESIGIVGYGHIGKAIAKDFKDKYKLLVYDINNEIKNEIIDGIIYCSSLNEIYDKSDMLIGATGQDISSLNWLTNSTGNKILISVSSGDIEFNTIIKHCGSYLIEDLKSPLQILNIRTKMGHCLKILRGGMVANFTGSLNSSPGHIIQITRGLLFSAIIQILRDNKLLRNQTGAIMLDPEYQKEVVELWFKDQPERRDDYSNEILLGFKNTQWIEDNSAGRLIQINKL